MLARGLPKDTIRNTFFILLLFAILIKLSVGVGYINENDTYWYRQWAFGLQDGLFNIYLEADQITLDYPPIYLFFLFLTGQAYRIVGNDCHVYLQMFLMKFWPIVFDVICGCVLFRICSKYGQLTGLFAAAIWLFNPSILFNTSFWGQTDQLLCLVLLLSFWLLEKNRPVLCCVVFAIAGLTKFQCLYFTPVLLVDLYYKTNLKNFFKGIAAAAATVAAVFLPFMISAKQPMLFFNLYLQGQGSYPKCTLNAFNFYGMLSLNWVDDNIVLFGGLTLSMLSYFITALSVISVLLLYVFGKRKSAWVGSLLLMQCLFMLTTRMHERYQIVTLIFSLMAFVVHKNKQFLNLFVMLTIITFLNQLVPMFIWNQKNSPLGYSYGYIMLVISLFNFCIFLWSVYLCVNFFINKKQENAVLAEKTIGVN